MANANELVCDRVANGIAGVLRRELGPTLVAYGGKFEAFEKKLADRDEEIVGLKGEVAGLTGEVTGLRGEMDELKRPVQDRAGGTAASQPSGVGAAAPPPPTQQRAIAASGDPTRQLGPSAPTNSTQTSTSGPPAAASKSRSVAKSTRLFAPQHRSHPDPGPAIMTPDLPPDEYLIVLLGDGRKWTHKELPKAAWDAYIAELVSFENASNKVVGGPNFWANLLDYHRGPKAKIVCLGVQMSTMSASTWTKEKPGESACMTCTNKQRPCIVYDDVIQRITMLPLVEEARFGADEHQAGYWVCTVKDFSSASATKRYRGLWEA